MPAASQAGKKASKAQLAGIVNRRILTILATNVEGSAEALAVVAQAAKGQGRAMHAATVILAHTSATTDLTRQGMRLPAHLFLPCILFLCML